MHIPAPLRAAVGLVATAADEARRLPDRALELPMLAVSTALQASVRAQQRYARLTARGDALLNRREPTDEPPAWATFDAPLPAGALDRPQSRFDTVDTVGTDTLPGDSATQSARLFGELIGVNDSPNGANAAAEHQSAPPASAGATQPRQPPPAKKAARPAKSAAKSPAKSTTKSAAKSTAKSAPKKSTSATRRPSTSGSDAE